MKNRIKWFVCGIAFCGLVAATVHAEPIAYPSKGQSQAQQDKDRAECHQWAFKTTGVDPDRLPPPPSSGQNNQNDGRVLRSTARGAAVGGLGGSMGGEFGKGAAVGAAAGVVVGGIRKRRDKKAQQQADAVALQQINAMLQKYDKAFGACMQGRNYTVKY